MAQRSDQTTDASSLDQRSFIIIGCSWLYWTKRLSTSCISIALPDSGLYAPNDSMYPCRVRPGTSCFPSFPHSAKCNYRPVSRVNRFRQHSKARRQESQSCGGSVLDSETTRFKEPREAWTTVDLFNFPSHLLLHLATCLSHHLRLSSTSYASICTCICCMPCAGSRKTNQCEWVLSS